VNGDFFVGIFSQPVLRPSATERRVARYARYRASAKGRARTQRYNASQAHRDCVARYRDTLKGIFAAQRSALNQCTRAHAGQWEILTALYPDVAAEVASW
jgi:hypothetical protein